MSTPSKPAAARKRSPKRDDEDQQRVILLLDMDCFYAQCETVRLGLDRDIPLALIQWNSALAVSYPARKFGIVRGDTFEKIREKSKGECVCIHLPVTTFNDSSHTKGQESSSAAQTQSENDASMGHMGEDIKASYDAEFKQPDHIREEMYKREKNKMRSRTEGKACLDRYRLASARIFALIDETLANNLGKKNYILERSSIDELFIDVTAFCNNPDYAPDESSGDHESNKNGSESPSIEIQFRSTCQNDALQSLAETNICDESNLHPYCVQAENALVLGCHIARIVRRKVFDELNFTLSAGISTSKLVAKLGATYGKPNGQAVIFPNAIPKIMDQTKIKKARMLGGKLGKKVMGLLPETETTMGSIARLLSLDDLIKGLGEESGRWVFHACRGICTEEVKSTLKVLPKSITAFKSFNNNGIGYPELEKWIELLASDIMKRVELDTSRNNRAPKSCTLGFTTEYGGPWVGKSVRLSFPSDRDFDARVKKLIVNTRKVLTENGVPNVIRLGFSAIDFVTRPTKGIESFFAAEAKNSPLKISGNKNKHPAKKRQQVKPSGMESFLLNEKCGNEYARNNLTPEKKHQILVNTKSAARVEEGSACHDEMQSEDDCGNSATLTDEEIARRLHDELNSHHVDVQPKQETDRDEAIAMKLQSKYDREHAVLSSVEKFATNNNKRKETENCKTASGSKVPKKSKINSYFSVVKK